MNQIVKVLVFTLLAVSTLCYLELQLSRYELKDSLKNAGTRCITKQVDKQLQGKLKQQRSRKKKKKSDDDDDEEQIDDDKIQQNQNYKEICYDKDISYSLPIYLKDKINFISLDTTVPISWFKGQTCRLEGSTKKCSLITKNLKDTISKILNKKQPKKQSSTQNYAIIEGSSQLVKGIQQKGQNFAFITRDSSRLTSLLELLMLGFYMRGEKDTVQLQNTNFIKATEISTNLNYLCDGAISLRFDSMSQNSFLKQLIDYQNHGQKYVTIYLEPYGQSFVTVGQVAAKYSQNGYGGIEWIAIKDDQNYGKLPIITDIIIENQGKNLFSELKDKQYPAVISLSASYIGIPKEVMAEWLGKFSKKSNCSINEQNKYLQCSHLKQKDESKIITFVFQGKKLSFKLSELILGKVSGKTRLNMKQTMHNQYAILGQPLFKKYLIVFDYTNYKVGISEKRIKSQAQFINVVSLVRFICFVFLFGCSFILCFLPIKRCIQVIKSRTKYGFGKQNKGEIRRLKASYAPIQQNPYDELNNKMKEVLDSPQHP